jgi:hypothetical protein
MDDKKLRALAKKNAAKSHIQQNTRRVYDATLEATRPANTGEESEADEIFREMKRREF